MPSSTTELIKSKLDVVEVLRGYLTLQPAGKNFKALCPFHNEKSPSFIVSPERQTWHCFGCSTGGDIFTFVMKYENLEFGDALRLLAEKAGVELRRENPAEYRYTGLLYDLNDQAKNFFRKSLAAAPVAKKYLEERGLAQQTIDEFELGWAPQAPEELSMSLLNAGAAPQDLIQAGLSIKTERGMMLDRFRGRIMFPIHNHLGKVVGFTGRILPQFDTTNNPGTSGFVTAKYVNSPETPIFQKSKLLYGFWKSKEGIREAKSAFLVEGQMDYLMSWQSGVKNVIASSGTALTADHLHSLHRLADELILSFDNDAAGSDAAERGIDLAEANDFTVKVAVIAVPGAKDAADAAKADPASIRRAIDAAMPAPEFYFKKYLPEERVTEQELRSRDGLHKLRILLGKLQRISSPIERESWMKELSRRTGIPERTLEEEATKNDAASGMPSQGQPAARFSQGSQQDPAAGSAEGDAPRRQLTRQERLSEDLLALAVAQGNFAFLDDCVGFFTPVQKEIFEILKSGQRRSDDPALDAAIDLIVLRDPDAMRGALAGDNAALKAGLAKEYYKERRHILTLAIKNAEARGNEVELAAALEEMKKLPSGPEES